MAGSIRKRGTGTWEITFDLGTDPQTGERLRRFFSVKGTRRDAEKALTESLHKRDTGIDVDPDRITLAAYLDRWLKDYAQHNLAKSTLQRYRSIVENHLKRKLGNLRVQELRPAHIQAAYSEFLSEGLAPRTVMQHHHVLREALHHAVQWQLVARNVADAVTTPRPERFEMRALDPEEVGRLAATAKGTPIEVMVLFSLDTGMRQGELLALRWQDVDLRMGTIHVVSSARSYPGEGVVIGPTKTHRSRRQIALAADTVRALTDHRVSQNEWRLRLGPAWVDKDLVFPGPSGTSFPARNVYREFVKVVTAANLQPLRWHDLRHTAATLMLRAGVNPKMVSERLGHSTVAFTLDTYAHVLPDMQRDAAETLAAAIRGRS